MGLIINEKIVEYFEKLKKILIALEAAEEIRDLQCFPSFGLHPLKGELKGFWSIKITGNFRIIFRFENGDVFDIDYVDYH